MYLFWRSERIIIINVLFTSGFLCFTREHPCFVGDVPPPYHCQFTRQNLVTWWPVAYYSRSACFQCAIFGSMSSQTAHPLPPENRLDLMSILRRSPACNEDPSCVVLCHTAALSLPRCLRGVVSMSGNYVELKVVLVHSASIRQPVCDLPVWLTSQ